MTKVGIQGIEIDFVYCILIYFGFAFLVLNGKEKNRQPSHSVHTETNNMPFGVDAVHTVTGGMKNSFYLVQ